MKHALLENQIKNVIILVLLVIAFSPIQNSIRAIDSSQLGNLLGAVGILSVIACFGNFAFTYEKVDFSKFETRLMAHATTGVLMLLIGLSLEMTAFIVAKLVGSLPMFNVSLILLYFASVLYDFWDLRRMAFQ